MVEDKYRKEKGIGNMQGGSDLGVGGNPLGETTGTSGIGGSELGTTGNIGGGNLGERNVGGNIGGGNLGGTESMQGGGLNRLRDAWRTGSPEKVKEEARTFVEKSVKAVSGALKGFADSVREEKVAEEVKDVIRETGDTAKAVASETRQKLGEVSEEARNLAKETKSQVGKARSEMGGGKKEGSSGLPHTGTSKPYHSLEDEGGGSGGI